MAEKEKGILGDVAQGGILGLQKAIKGVAELGTTAVDLFADTNLTADLQEYFDKRMVDKPTGTAGEVASFITQFGVPGLGAAGLLARSGNLSNLQKALTFGVVDGAVATDDTTTLLDAFVDNDSDEERLKRLSGSEAAYNRLLERADVAIEASALIAGLPYALKGVTSAVGGTLDAFSPVAAKIVASSNLAQKTTRAKDFTGEMTEQNLNAFDKFTNLFSAKGVGLRGEGVPNLFVRQAKAARSQITLNDLERVDTNMKAMQKTISKLDLSQTEALSMSRSIEDALFPKIKVLYQQPNLKKEEVNKVARELSQQAKTNIKQIEDGMVKKYDSLGIPKEIRISNLIDDVRTHIDDLSEQIINLKNTDEAAFEASLNESGLLQAIAGNLGLYGTRVYRAFLDGGQYLKNLDPKIKQDAINEIKKVTGFDDERANFVWNNMTVRGSKSATNKDFSGFETEEFISEGLKKSEQGIFKGKTLDNLPAVRRALGEVSGYLETSPEKALNNTAFVTAQTVSKLSNFIAKTKTFEDIKKINDISFNIGTKPFLRSSDFVKDVPEIDGAFTKTVNGVDIRYKKFDENFGALNGMVTREDFYNAISRTTTSFDQNSNVLLKAYAPILALKSISQYGKTVFSPLAQVRNNTSIPFFALLNGNVGSTGRLVDAYANTFAGLYDPINKKLRSEVIQELTEEGLIQRGGSAVFGELKRNAEIASEALPLIQKSISAVKGTPGIKQSTKIAEEVYKMTDDTARVYNYILEKNRFLGSLKTIRNNTNLKPGEEFVPVEAIGNLTRFSDDITIGKNGGAVLDVTKLTDDQLEAFVRKETAELTLNTVKNYQRVVPIVRDGISRLPIGNFTAFPAEMLRNGTNALYRAIRELGSESPEIQKIGMRRLAGAITAGGGVGAGLVAVGSYLTGVTAEQIDAYKRSVGAPWDETATLVPTGSDENGNPTEFFNFSYMNPYDLFRRPALKILAEVEEGNRNEQSLVGILRDSMFGGVGELLSPFVEPAFGVNAIVDASRGETGTGRRIWREGDSEGDKMVKGFMYAIDTLAPSATPFTLVQDKGTSNLPFYTSLKLKDGPKSILNATKDGKPAVGKQGRELDVGETILQAFSGIKTIKPDLEKSLLYRGFEANSAIRDSSNEFNSYLRSYDEKTAEAYTKQYIAANENRYRALRDLYQVLEDTRLLGMSIDQQKEILKQAKITNYEEVLLNRFQPIPIDDNRILEEYLKGKDIDAPRLKVEEERLKFEDLSGKFRGSQSQNRTTPNQQQGQQLISALRQAEINKLLGLT